MKTTYNGILWTCDNCGAGQTVQAGKWPLGLVGSVQQTTTGGSEQWEWYACTERCVGKAVRNARPTPAGQMLPAHDAQSSQPAQSSQSGQPEGRASV